MAEQPRADVRNAADRRQVETARRRERRLHRERLERYRVTLQTYDGRAVLWDLLERLGVYRSVWDPGARIHYNAGRQDAGHELMATVLEADEQGYARMAAEARERTRRDDAERDAAHVASAQEQE